MQNYDRMKSTICYGLFLLAFTTGCAKTASAPQSAENTTSLSGRQQHLKENIEYQLREGLKGRSVTVGPIEDSDFTGFDKSSFEVGRDHFPLLVSEDDKHILLLAAEPLSALSSEEIAASLKKEAEEEEQAAAERAVKLADESQRSPVRGNAQAAVTVVEFSDFECPYCRRGFSTMNELMAKHADDVRFVYMHFPLPFHPWARPSAIASACAAQQGDGAFWALHDYYFENQNAVEVSNVIEKSRDVLKGTGVDLSDWETCATDTTSDMHAKAVSLVDTQLQLGRDAGVTGTPGFFVNGTFISGAQPLDVFEKAIEEAKAKL